MVKTTQTTKPKIKTQTWRLQPLEDLLHYQVMLEFSLHNLQVGAYLLKKRENAPFTLVFGFKSPGIHSFLSEQEFERVFGLLEDGIKDFRRSRVTFHLSAYKSDAERMAELSDLSDSTSEPLQFILESEKQRVSEISRQGWREPKDLYIFVTYTASQGQYQDKLDRWLDQLNRFWLSLQGMTQAHKTQQLTHFLDRGLKDGFLYWKTLFENKLELKVNPLNPQQMYDYLLGRFKWNFVSTPVPQTLQRTSIGWKYQTHSQLHATSQMAQVTPHFEREWVKLGDEYVGVLTFWEKPGGWKNKVKQLHYFWDLVAKELVTDTEIITQVMPADSRRTTWALRQMTYQNANKLKGSVERNQTDILAKIQSQTGEEAQAKLYLGEVPFYVAVIILVRRKSLQELEQACSFVEASFYRPAWVVRERQIAWKWWLQSLPIVDEDLLCSGLIQRRHLYFNSEVLGFLPIVKTQSNDTKGFELIGSDGGTPIHFNLADPRKHRNVLILGTTRSGKSVLVSGILTSVLAAGTPVVAIDYPKEDGSSTFSTYTDFLGKGLGTYLNINEKSLNLFDRPDLSLLERDEQAVRFESYKEFRVRVLLIMVMGESEPSLLRDTVKSILYFTVNRFFADPDIQASYEVAEAGGLGSLAWQSMPTLHTFYDFFLALIENQEFVAFKTLTSSQLQLSATAKQQALEIIELKLRNWKDSRIGKCIAAPSNVDRDTLLFVTAMTGIGSDEDAAVLTMASYANSLTRSMKYPTSILFIDECPILFKFPSLVDLVASIFSNGAKSGIRVILCSQEPKSILNTKSADQILTNTSTILVGKVVPQKISMDSYIEQLGFEEEMVRACTKFQPKPWGLYTQWLVRDGNLFTFCRYYPSPIQLALVANNNYEQYVRERFFAAYSNQYKATFHFSQALVESIQSDKPLEEVARKYLPSPCVSPLKAA